MRIHEQWANIYKNWCSVLTLSLEGYGILFAVLAVATPGAKPAYKDLHIWSIVAGLFILVLPSHFSGPWGPRIVTLLVNFFGAIARMDLPKTLTPMVVLGNVMMCFLSADPIFAICSRALCMPLYVLVDWCREPAEADAEQLLLIVTNEVFTCFFLFVILLQSDFLFCKKEVATMSLEKQVVQREEDMKEMEQFVRAAKRLISVVCDSCDLLSQDWEVRQPSQKILQLLHMEIWQEQGPLDFLSYVCEEDQERFRSFINESSSDAPSSIHLQMKTSKNVPFAAQLFNVSLPSHLSHSIQHLVGITVQQPTSPQESLSIPEHDLFDAGLPGIRPRCRRASSQVRAQRRRTNMSVVCHKDSGSSSAGSDVSSSSKSQIGAGWTLVPFLRDGLQEVESVQVMVDMMSGGSGYAIREAVVKYKSSSAMEKLPHLFNWVKPKYQPKVEDWMQEHMNSWYHAEQSEEKCLAIKFGIPGLAATCAVGEMSVREIVESMADHQSDEVYELLMRMELRTLIPA